MLSRNEIHQHNQADNNQHKIQHGNGEHLYTVCPLEIFLTLVAESDTQMTAEHDHYSTPEAIGFGFGVYLVVVVLIEIVHGRILLWCRMRSTMVCGLNDGG